MKSFDQRAQHWDLDPMKVARAAAVATAIKQRVDLTPAMSVFEYGCGTGLLSFSLQDTVGHITLADSSEGMLQALRAKIGAEATNMTPIKLDLMTDPPPEQQYDVVYTLMTLHHIPDTAGILERFYYLLRNDGCLCVADLDYEDGSFHGPGFTGHRGFDRDALGTLARAQGFSGVAFDTVYEIKKSTEYGERLFRVFLMTAVKGTP